MSELIECPKCGGLKRDASGCCPHCGCHAPVWRRWLARLLAVVGSVSVANCSSTVAVPYGLAASTSGGYTATDAYGIVPLHDAGVDAGRDAGPDGGLHDAGSDAGD